MSLADRRETRLGPTRGRCERRGTMLERGHHAFGHRRRHELVRVRDTFVRRPDDALSHLRFGRSRT